MPTTGEVEITVSDNTQGIVTVPRSNVQVVIGCSTTGTVGSPFATRSPSALKSTFGDGDLVEAGALSCLAGGLVIAIRAAKKTAGTAGAFTSSLNASTPTVASATLDGTYGAYHNMNIVFKCTRSAAGPGGTALGIAGIYYQISLDGGRNFGVEAALGTATTIAIPNTGVTISFTSGASKSLLAGDTCTFSTYAMSADPTDVNGGIRECLLNLQASPYATSGWGSMLITGGRTGTQAFQGWNAADIASIQGYLDTLATGYVFTGAIFASRDASPAAKWSGTAETEAAWTTSVTTDYAAASAKRACVSAGWYNMPSAFANGLGGAWVPRRPLSWAAAARRVQVPAQRHTGRVRDGSLSNITIDPTNDPVDGFIYHDERINAGFDLVRFMSARTRVGYGGYFVANDNMMSPPTSDFKLLPLRNVMDIACSIVHQIGSLFINSDVRLNLNGTIYENDARAIEIAIKGAIDSNMTAAGAISSCQVQVDRTTNVGSTSKVIITVTIKARGYILEQDVTIGFGSAAAA